MIAKITELELECQAQALYCLACTHDIDDTHSNNMRQDLF